MGAEVPRIGANGDDRELRGGLNTIGDRAAADPFPRSSGLLESHSSVDSIADEWDDLADRVGASPFLRSGWYRAFTGAFSREGFEVLALRHDRRLSALLPLHVRRGSLCSPTNEHTPEFGLLAERPEAARALAEAIFDRRPRSIHFDVLGAERGLHELHAAARAAGYRTIVRRTLQSPYVDIRDGWASYRASIGRKTRHEVNRLLRRLHGDGQASFEIYTGDERLDEVLTEGFELEASGWKAQERTAIVSRRETLEFYRDIAHWAADLGILRLAFLKLDGKPLAFSLGLEHAGVYYVLKGGYDPAFKRYAPGVLLRHELLARAFAEGLTRYEFLGADEPWKLAWTSTTHDRFRFLAYPSSPRGLARWTTARFGRPVGGRLRAFARNPRQMFPVRRRKGRGF